MWYCLTLVHIHTVDAELSPRLVFRVKEEGAQSQQSHFVFSVINKKVCLPDSF